MEGGDTYSVHYVRDPITEPSDIIGSAQQWKHDSNSISYQDTNIIRTGSFFQIPKTVESIHWFLAVKIHYFVHL